MTPNTETTDTATGTADWQCPDCLLRISQNEILRHALFSAQTAIRCHGASGDGHYITDAIPIKEG